MKTVFICWLITVFRTRSALILTALVLCTLALVQKSKALNPPPDGGYPGGNTAEGQGALLNLTSGTFNTAVGLFSLRSNAQQQLQHGRRRWHVIRQHCGPKYSHWRRHSFQQHHGTLNTATGAFALFSNIGGSGNNAFGDSALFSNTIGGQNTATGDITLRENTTGSNNTANGAGALNSNTTGDGNTAIGVDALLSNTTASENTASVLSRCKTTPLAVRRMEMG